METQCIPGVDAVEPRQTKGATQGEACNPAGEESRPGALKANHIGETTVIALYLSNTKSEW